MNKYLEQVKDFHEAFNHPVEETIEEHGNHKLRELRLKLLYEEIEELSNAMGTDGTLHKLCKETLTKPINNIMYDKTETLDALCDIQYVLSGAVISLGYKNVFDEAFDEVQRSNMSKMCSTIEQSEDTIKYYKEERNEPLDINVTEKEDGYIIVREDGKILKNKYYSPADLEQFIK
jgi:predicted HAD superfamily Cof-like phosphohydrolase